jgi:hypothetical protein
LIDEPALAQSPSALNSESLSSVGYLIVFSLNYLLQEFGVTASTDRICCCSIVYNALLARLAVSASRRGRPTNKRSMVRRDKGGRG